MSTLQQIASYAAREWIGLTMWVVGLVLSIAFYLRPRRTRQPTYSMRSHQLISSDKIKHQLEIRLKGKAVHNLVISRIAFWNAGTEAIKDEDCDIRRKPLFKIASTGHCTVLDLDFFDETQVPENIRLSQESQGIFGLDFDFVSPGDGVVLTLAHEGIVQQPPAITMSMVNGRREALRRLDVDDALVNWLVAGSGTLTRRSAPWVLALIALALMALAGFFQISGEYHESGLVVAIIFVVGISYLYAAYTLRSRMPQHLIGLYSE